MLRSKIAAAVLCGIAAAPAGAEWLEATTKHFVVYADTKPDVIEREASNLELLDNFLRTYHRRPTSTDQDANRLKVYMHRDLDALRRLYGNSGSSVAGYYQGRVTGSVAFTALRSDDREGGPRALTPRMVLNHEYAHHFLLGNYAMAYPAWFSEGYAEFVSTFAPEKDTIIFGRSAGHRAFGIADPYFMGLSTKAMFQPPELLTGMQLETIYARGWLLTHYLMLDKTRAAQLDKYLASFNAGVPSVQAATAAFGDLDKLGAAMDKYVSQRMLPAVELRRSQLPAIDVSVRRLTAGEAAMMPARMQSENGVDTKTALSLFNRAAPIAAAHAGDANAQAWFAEIAYDAERDKEAEAAADRALAIDPKNAQALLYKARLRLRQAVKADKDRALAEQARTFIRRANAISNDNAAALYLFYSSFVSVNDRPTRNAVEALRRAQELVPQDPEVRLALVREELEQNDIAAARFVLLPLAYSPHTAQQGKPKKLLAAIDAKQPKAELLKLLDAEDPKKGGDKKK